MADIIDLATDNMEKSFSRLKTNIFDGESSTHCKECDDPIPERRRSVGNIHLCVGCSTVVESKSKHRR